ncbi:MAG TPA: fibronectin type III domain-containing protein [Thermotogota bacterium]|nr:fibronectin type III domain-containing protein [Thermotogota bacterium]
MRKRFFNVMIIFLLFFFVSSCTPKQEEQVVQFLLSLSSTPYTGVTLQHNGQDVDTPYQVHLDQGTSQQLSVESPQYLKKTQLFAGNDTRVHFQEWSNGSEATSISVEMEGNVSLTALFDTDFYLSAQLESSASREELPVFGWYASGTVVELEPGGVPGESFDHWLVNGVNGGDDSPLFLTMSGPMKVRAVFTENPEGPGDFSVFSPSNGATQVAINPTQLMWTASSDPSGGQVRYAVFLDGSPNPSTLVAEDISETFLQLDTLEASRTYYWYVRASNAFGLTNRTGTVSFSTISFPPGLPFFLAPYDGQQGASYITTLSWGCEGAVEYDLYFGTEQDPPLLEESLSETQYTLDPLQPGATYYWKVVGRNFLGETTGPVWAFSVSDETIPPGFPHSPTPAGGAIQQELELLLSWEQPPTGTVPFRYDVFLGPASVGMEEISSDQHATSVQVSDLLPNTVYFWQVLAQNPWGLSPGPIWSFTTTDGPMKPTVPSNPLPANGSSGVATGVSLAWDACTYGVVTYDVLFGEEPVPSTVIASALSEPAFSPPQPLEPSTTYYWQVIAQNYAGQTPGPIWSFSTIGLPAMIYLESLSAVSFAVKARGFFDVDDVVVFELASWQMDDSSLDAVPAPVLESTQGTVTTFPYVDGLSAFSHFQVTNLHLATISCSEPGTVCLTRFMNGDLELTVSSTPVLIP